MTVQHRTAVHTLVVNDDPDESEWDGERFWHIEHPDCPHQPGPLSTPEFEYYEYKCGVAYEEQEVGRDGLFGGPQYWPDGHFRQHFRIVQYRDYFGDVDIELETVDESGGE